MRMESDEREELICPSRPPEPKDRYKIVYIIFYLLGIGSLLPWNFFITANKYFQFKLRNTTLPWDDGVIKTDLQVTFEGSVTIASTVPNLVFNCLTALLASRIPLKGRMVFSNATVIIVFIITVCFVDINTDKWQVIFYSCTLLSVVILSAASSVFMASMFGLAGMFPIAYMQAVMSGQAVGGVFAAVANILSIAAAGNVKRSAFSFFALATVTSILTLAGYLALYKNEFSRYYIYRQTEIEIIPDSEERHAEENHTLQNPQKVSSSNSYYLIVFKKIWLDSLGAGFVFFVTLTCFPALASAIVSESDISSVWRDQYFSAVVCFLLFNIGDWSGRVLAGLIKWPNDRQRLLILPMCFLRVAFIPLIMFCNVQPRTLSVWFENDFFPLAFILTLGLSNGYLSTLCMMYGPKRVQPEYAEFAGALMSASLTIGLAAGSLLGLIIVKFIV